VQRRLKQHSQIVVEKDGRYHRYRWTPDDGWPPGPAEAFERLMSQRLVPVERDQLADMVRLALTGNAAVGPSPSTRLQQAEMDAARALAEMAIEVEELAAKEVSARAMIHRVRARMKRMRLEPIDRAGEEVPFDRQRHLPIGPDIRDGAPVVIVRPGYVWKTPERDVLIERPVVQD
jgi:hypothetical protein